MRPGDVVSLAWAAPLPAKGPKLTGESRPVTATTPGQSRQTPANVFRDLSSNSSRLTRLSARAGQMRQGPVNDVDFGC